VAEAFFWVVLLLCKEGGVMKIAAFLPSKGSSERIPSKNLALLDCKPLFLYTLEKLCKCGFIDEVYLDSESDEILNYAPFLPYKPLKRDPELATNKTNGHQMFYNEIRQVDADIYIQILGTSPFIKPETIRKGLEILKSDSTFDSVVLVKSEKQYRWEHNNPLYDIDNIPNSKDLPDTVTETMGLYIVRKEAAQKYRKRIGKRPYLLEADPIEAIDVNYPADFILADAVAKGLRSAEASKLRMMSVAFSSAIFSDILAEQNIGGLISGLKPNFPEARMMARANTLKLRKKRDRESYEGIYDALQTYHKMGAGEIIVVENETFDRAYFGELNAHLALRSGVSGAIIGGVTRDASEVKRIRFPVFAADNCSLDVRGAAVMESHNQPVSIQGVEVVPGDLVFADCNGIAVIPQKYETQVLDLAFDAVHKEKTVLDKVFGQMDAHTIYETIGEF
jgi:regulator of RNase E activity RraA/CMP-N-acetylneuraminic acid synthetase